MSLYDIAQLIGRISRLFSEKSNTGIDMLHSIDDTLKRIEEKLCTLENQDSIHQKKI